MIAIGFSTTKQTPDIDVKQAAALKQMQALQARLTEGPKYHTLTQADRQRLIKEGYAADLVDNLVFITQRNAANQSGAKDQLVTGFTYAAFDPALYATDEMSLHLQQINQGCCCYCESYLSATEGGKVSHFRPVQLLDEVGASPADIINQCSPYYHLAYQQDNLVYCCHACDEQYKAGQFPIVGKRFPKVELEHEQGLLIDPYYDDPRQHIRFNPQNGQAYAYDLVQLFYQQTQSLDKDDIAKLLWRQPSAIPLQCNAAGQSISPKELDQQFHTWLSQYLNSGGVSKGHITITTLGLNRPALVLARLASLNQLKLSAPVADKSKLNDIAMAHSHAYRSLAIDALHSWHYQQTSENSEVVVAPQATGPATSPAVAVRPQAFKFPQWFRASLRYFVTESELDKTQQRQLVCLSSKDRVYGQQPKEKCVFLPIDWEKDASNIIKVRSHRNIWESSFSELARSRPLELINLFTHNEVWVEGAFEALTT
ncbi:hypothetical protein [Shewanella waksmanii]|uniref:hypothetical protein n=1 Tax=Shewanella waksmanii TaxID=213783 RepID=UPI003736C42C